MNGTTKNGHWTTRRLDECASFLSGGTPSKAKPEYWTGDIPWVSCKDMKSDRLYDAEDHVSEVGAEAGTRLVDAGTVLIVVRGMILAKEFPVALAMRQMAFNQDLKAVRPEPDLDSRFLYYWLKANTPNVLGIADEAAHGTKRLQSDRLGALPVSYPSVEEQKALVAPLVAIDDLIDVNSKRIGLLEEMARRLYEEWFVRFRFPGHEGCRFVSSELGRIPFGWPVVRLDDAVILNPRVSVDATDSIIFVPMGSLSERHSTIGAWEERSKASGSRFQNGDTLLARITPCLENGKTAFVKFLPPDRPAASGSTEFIVLRSHTLTHEFVYLLARSEGLRELAIKSMSGASGRQRVQEVAVAGFKFAHPPTGLLADFAKVVEPLFDLVYSAHCQVGNLRSMRDSILPRIMSGTLK